jgi:hypothetical protein
MTEDAVTYSSPDAKRFFEAFDRHVEAQPKDVRSFMEQAGFEVAHTGGGCLAYEKEFGDHHVLITADDGVTLPQSLDAAAGVGAYGPDGEWLNADESLSAPELVAVCGTLMAAARRRFAVDGAQEIVSLVDWIAEAGEHGLVVPAEAEAVDAVLAKLQAPQAAI